MESDVAAKLLLPHGGTVGGVGRGGVEHYERWRSGGDGNPFRASLPMSERGNNCGMAHLQREMATMATKEPAKSANAERRRMATPKTSYTSRRNVNLVGSVCICWIRGTYLAGVYICVLSLPLKIASKM